MLNIQVDEIIGDAFKVKAVEPDQFPAIEKIFEAQGLENNKSGVEILKGYAVEASHRLIGGAEVMLQDGEYTFSVAINDPFKRQGIGKYLFQSVEKEIRSLGGKKILIQAKIPAYWTKFGFMEVFDLNDVPKSFRCDDCSKYGKECFPKIMVLDL
jgi:N-acetylglutamate synthase-like GNAT family acetyltransferase